MTTQNRKSGEPEAPDNSPGDRLADAMRAHQAGDVAGALKTYFELLEQFPRSATLLHLMGMGQIQVKWYQEGEANVKLALKIDPAYHDAWNTLGNLYRLSGRPEEALEAYQKVIDLEPDAIPAWINLGDLYRQTRNTEGARRAFERAAQLSESGSAESSPMRFKVLCGLASLKRLTLEWDECIRLYGLALQIEPNNPRCRRDLIYATERSGRKDRALELAREWLDREPEHPAARRSYASLTGINTPERATDNEVASLFDEFAGIFDEQLAELAYRAPELIQQAVADALGPGAGTLDVCDTGCGTGLCGLWLKEYSRRLTGVDLSQGMLDLARERKLYDVLERAELTEWLLARRGEFDLIACADVLCYFGSLTGYCAAAQGALRPGGLVAFTVEYQEERVATGYHLQLNGRYTHNEDYVRRCLADAGFADIRADHAHLRLEMGQPVRGLVVSARRP